jgi:hypothetical protein
MALPEPGRPEADRILLPPLAPCMTRQTETRQTHWQIYVQVVTRG